MWTCIGYLLIFYLQTWYYLVVNIKIKWSRYRPSVAQMVGRGIALFLHDCGTRRGWVVSSTPRPHFTPEKNTVPVLQEAGWAPVPVWTGGKSRPRRDSISDRPARSQSLYRLSYPAHILLLLVHLSIWEHDWLDFGSRIWTQGMQVNFWSGVTLRSS